MMYHFEKTVILSDFSRSNSFSICQLFKNEGDSVIDLVHEYRFYFFGNGNCIENKGYVSIILMDRFERKKKNIFNDSDVTFFFSVVDISGNKRFTQSFIVNFSMIELLCYTQGSKSNSLFGLERYLRRETLLNDPVELLPGDCLTILVEIDYIYNFPLPNLTLHRFKGKYPLQRLMKLKFSMNFSFPLDEYGRTYIPLDMFYGRELCTLSGFFRLASETTLTESATRRVHIPHEELDDFYIICNILFTPNMELEVDSIQDICELYVIADKYDFQSIIEDCRQLIKAFMRTTNDAKIQEHAAKSVPDIIKLSEEYKDSDLKDTVKIYRESNDISGMNDYALGEYLKEKLFSDWKCVYKKEVGVFTLSRKMKPEFESYL